jgi:outer membrane murein-binding lipoprotein Lpp
MESVLVALVSGVLTLVGVLVSNSRSRAIMEVRIDELSRHVERHNNMVERTYKLERDMALARNDIDAIKEEARTR